MAAKPGSRQNQPSRPGRSPQKPGAPPPGNPSKGDSFLIVTEGAVTEKLYFESLRKVLQLTPVTVRVIHPGCTDAEGLVRAAMAMYETDRDGNRQALGNLGNREVQFYDHVWVLFDTDVPERQGQLGPAMELARQENIHIGHSTPCAEMWLLLHFRDRPGPMRDSTAAEASVSAAWGQRYDKSAGTFLKLWASLRPNISQAVTRSDKVRDFHTKADTKFPCNPSTQLDLLVRALNATVQPHLRIIP